VWHVTPEGFLALEAMWAKSLHLCLEQFGWRCTQCWLES
jgi:hypothetical protein